MKAYAADFETAFAGFDAWLKRELVDGCLTVAVNAEEARIAEEIFRRVEPLPLLDKYEAYQLLDDEWRQTAIDLEIIQTDGFEAVRAVDPNMVPKKGKSEDEMVEVQDGWVGRIFPFELVHRVYFPDEIAEIAAKSREAERLEAELASLAADVPEDERDGVIVEDGEEFDPKLVAAKAKEILDDVETDETKALDLYLTLTAAKDKLAFQEEHPEVNWQSMEPSRNGTYKRGEIQGRQRAIREGFAFPDESFEKTIVRADRLFSDLKTLKNEARKQEKSLEEKAIEKIKSLTDEEAYALLEAKWVAPLAEKLRALPESIVGALAAKIKALATKYETTLSDVEAKIETAESDLVAMLGELDGNADDLAGIAAWREELGR